MSLYVDCIRYGASLIVEGSITFEQLMTAMLALMFGALGLGQALNDLGDLLHPCLHSFLSLHLPAFLHSFLAAFLQPSCLFSLFPLSVLPSIILACLHAA
jgi:hypothetical protein